MPLSTTTSYYLRQLVYKNRARLKFVVAPKAGLEAHALADMDAVLISLYIDDEVIRKTSEKLESLVLMHRALEKQGKMYIQHQLDIEKKILWLLGFLILEEQQVS